VDEPFCDECAMHMHVYLGAPSEIFVFWSLLKTFFTNSFLSKRFLTIDHFSAY